MSPNAALLRSAIVLAAAATLVGCNSGRTESYSVSLHNDSPSVVTVWLTKTGERDGQEDWLAPEDLSSARIASVDQLNGQRVPPGKTARIGPLAGKFGYEDLAMLRVYAGALSYDQILATTPDGSLRVDVPLREGMNRLVVRPSAKLTVERDDGATTSNP